MLGRGGVPHDGKKWDGKTCHSDCKACLGKYGNQCTSCKDPSLKLVETRIFGKGSQKYGYCWDGKCFRGNVLCGGKRKCHGCQTCRGKGPRDCTSCPEGTFLATEKLVETASGTKPSGRCVAPPALKDFDPGRGVQCSYSKCTDGTTGYVLGFQAQYADAKKTACSRVCLVGGQLTRAYSLKRWTNETGGWTKRTVDAKLRSGASMSAPVCVLYKSVTCTKNEHFDLAKCAKFTKNTVELGAARTTADETKVAWKEGFTAGYAAPKKKAAQTGRGEARKHCDQEKCNVLKKVGCVAILPLRFWRKRTVGTVLGADLSAYTNGCRDAINPCDAAALFL